MIRCVAFDFDGTLVDSNAVKQQAFVDVVADLPGGAALMTRVLSEHGGDRFAVMAKFAADWNQASADRVDAGALARAYTARCEAAIAGGRDFPGAEVLLQALIDAGVATALLSATPSRPLADLIVRKHWRRYFAHVIGDASDKADALRELGRRAQLPPSAIVLIGDREVDRRGAAEFGCAFVGVRRDDNDFTTPPPRIVDSFTDVLPLVGLVGNQRR